MFRAVPRMNLGYLLPASAEMGVLSINGRYVNGFLWAYRKGEVENVYRGY